MLYLCCQLIVLVILIKYFIKAEEMDPVTSAMSRAPRTESEPGKQPRSTLLAVVVGREEATTCIIYPPDVAVPMRGSRWIHARGDSFVALTTCR